MQLDYLRPFTEEEKQLLDDWYFILPEHKEIWKARFALKDDKGALLEHHVYDSFVRIVNVIVPKEEERPIFIQALCEKKLLPAGRQWAQAGTGTTNLANCFVIGMEDDSHSILDAFRTHFLLQRSGGGTGINFSSLRPEGAICKTSTARSSGPLGFLDVFSRSSANVAQSGNRSGANMGMLHINHPSIIDFINFKAEGNWENIRAWAPIKDELEFQQFQWDNNYPGQMFNLSVLLTDEFMNNIDNLKATHTLKFNGIEWFLWTFLVKESGRTRTIEVVADTESTARHLALAQVPFFNGQLELLSGPARTSPKYYWDLICKRAWEDGCPGVFFIDRARRFHNGEYFAPLDASNPCGEQLLPRDSSCTLSSIPLPSFIHDGKFSFEEFKTAVVRGVVWLNYIVDKTNTGIKAIDKLRQDERRIGLSLTGTGDALAMLGLKYSSNEGRLFIAKVLELWRDTAYIASTSLAQDNGFFPAFTHDYMGSSFIETLPKDIQHEIIQNGIRNVTLLTQAPIGTTGTVSGFTTGPEPMFGLAWKRNSRVGSYVDMPYSLSLWLKEHHCYNQFCADVGLISEKDLRIKYAIPDYFETAHQVDVEGHIKMLALFQKYNDSGVSKTINLPHSATVEDVSKAFRLAYDLGCKSVTVYRDGSKTQILETMDKKEKDSRPESIIHTNAPSRPKVLDGHLYKVTVKGTPWVVTVGLLNNEPYEIFAGHDPLVKENTLSVPIDSSKTYKIKRIASGNYDVLDNDKILIKDIANLWQDDTEKALTRMLSTSLRHGVPLEFIIEQLSKTEGSIVEFSKVVSRVLRKYQHKEISKKSVCPSCNGTNLIREEACLKCLDCAWSKCS